MRFSPIFCLCPSPVTFNLLTQQASARLWTKGSASLCRHCRATIRASPIVACQSRQTTCSFLCPSVLGAFVLLLRSLVTQKVLFLWLRACLLALGIGDNREILAYFLWECREFREISEFKEYRGYSLCTLNSLYSLFSLIAHFLAQRIHLFFEASLLEKTLFLLRTSCCEGCDKILLFAFFFTLNFFVSL